MVEPAKQISPERSGGGHSVLCVVPTGAVGEDRAGKTAVDTQETTDSCANGNASLGPSLGLAELLQIPPDGRTLCDIGFKLLIKPHIGVGSIESR